MKLLIAIPAYNEAAVIAGVIKGIPEGINGFSKTDILVLDDGSIDGTSDVARSEGVKVISHLINRGLGGALKTIFGYARIRDYDCLVTMDADGQHDGKEISKLLKPLISGKADVVIGSRWTNGNTKPFARFAVNYIANILTFLLFGLWTTDSQSGLRAFNRKAISSVKVVTDGMEVSSEFFREIKRNGLKMAEIPIPAVYSDYSRTKGQRISDAPEVFFNLLLRLLR